MKTALTIKQSAELIKRGVNKDKASYDSCATSVASVVRTTVEPIFTLTDLLSLLPNNYPGDELDSGDKRVYLTITAVDWNLWMAKYSTINKVIAARANREMIDSVYELLLWAIDNNHVKLD